MLRVISPVLAIAMLAACGAAAPAHPPPTEQAKGTYVTLMTAYQIGNVNINGGDWAGCLGEAPQEIPGDPSGPVLVSPDGSKIAYDAGLGLEVSPVHGSPTAIAPGIEVLSWSPRGSYLAVRTLDDITLFALEGSTWSAAARITGPFGIVDGVPQDLFWSPDERELRFSSSGTNGYQVFVARAPDWIATSWLAGKQVIDYRPPLLLARDMASLQVQLIDETGPTVIRTLPEASARWSASGDFMLAGNDFLTASGDLVRHLDPFFDATWMPSGSDYLESVGGDVHLRSATDLSLDRKVLTVPGSNLQVTIVSAAASAACPALQ